MNTAGNWLSIAKTDDPERSEKWCNIFGVNAAPIKSIIPSIVSMTSAPDGAFCYWVDLQALTPEQFEKLIDHVIEKEPGISREWATNLINQFGVPIPAENVSVESTDIDQMLPIIASLYSPIEKLEDYDELESDDSEDV